MKCVSRGLLSDLVLVRMHGRAEAYLSASPTARAALAMDCRREAAVPDLAERILSRTIYAQAASRVAPLRELLQNALDASSHGTRIDVRVAEDGSELTLSDRGTGMTRDAVLHDLLVPFRSGKHGETDVIGEHGIGFFSALEIAPRLEVVTVTRAEVLHLQIQPVGSSPPHRDFVWTLWAHEPTDQSVTGTTVRLWPLHPLPTGLLAAEVASAARLVDPHVARIYVNDALANTARARMRRVSRAPIDLAGGTSEIALYLGRGEGVEPEWAITQGGLVVTNRQDAFSGNELGLHRDLLRALLGAGYGLVAELPVGVPLNKGRSAVAAGSRGPAERAVVEAFERFVLEDALYNRELLRAVDHRLATVLDRLVHDALAGELAPPERSVDEMAPTLRRRPQAAGGWGPRPAPPEPPPQPTVAAPEQVVRFATMLIDAPALSVVRYGADEREVRHADSVRGVLLAHRAGALRRFGEGKAPGLIYLVVADPLSEALWRRLCPSPDLAGATFAPGARAEDAAPPPMLQRIGRTELVRLASALPGVPALAATMGVLECIDLAISQSAELAPSPITVHQALYGPDEMAHTDGSGISVNLASPRVRTLVAALLGQGDVAAMGAFVDLLVHEKTHVSLASYVPRATAEHGTTFYRRKDLLRRRLLEALARGTVRDPMSSLPAARHGLTSIRLPSPEALSAALGDAELVAA